MTNPNVAGYTAIDNTAADNTAPDGKVPNNSASGREPAPGIQPTGRLGRLATETTVRHQRRVWSRRVNSWDHHTPAGLEKVTAAVLAAVTVRPGDQVVDLGCGTGQLSLPLAERGARVLAVDVSPPMVQRLKERARERSVPGLDCLAAPIENLSLPAGSVDLIVTSYALHHLRDADKDRLVAAAYHWLRPGGRLLVADMMFGRGGTSQDRAIIKSKVRALAKKGIGGWWRIAKNSYRYLVRVQERPVSISAWTAMFARAGFAGITASSIVAEAGLVSGHRSA
ncbi:MAG TPA: class I SAM-dependent methyltransferase [Streptosporangiaceae bacterium]|nr:class I SAM-dependent methyltransferase [Streptosporangiaceae bacterium]